MKIFGLIGYPLGHSFSKKYFEEKFIADGIHNASFELFPLKSINEFPGLVAAQPSLKGLAVTIPHKESVMQFLTEISDSAAAIGAVNCIKFSDGTSVGYNTDVIGFENSLQPLLNPHHRKALVLGTGGASKGVQFVLKKMGIEFLIVSRNQSPEQNCIQYSDIDKKMISDHSLIINATPAGMTPNEKAFPEIPYNFLTEKHLLYDLIYKPEKTSFIKNGEMQGASVKNGLEMFLIQAEENWKIWNS